MAVVRVGARPTKPGRYHFAESEQGPLLIVRVYERDGRLWQRIEGDPAGIEHALADADGAWSDRAID